MRPFGSGFDIVPLIIPVDLSTAANNGDWISLRNAEGIAFVVFKAAGPADQDPVLTFNQATDVAGTGSKALAAVSEYHHKQGALLTAVGVWTRVTQAASQTLTLNATSSESQGLYVVQIDAAQLDIANDFDCIQLAIADTGTTAQLGCALGLLYGVRFRATPANLVNAIID